MIGTTEEHDIRKIVARNLNIARLRRGLTINGLAEMSGIGKATLSGIENSAGNPTIETVWQLAKALDVPFGQLVEHSHGNEHVISERGVTATLIDSQTAPQEIETYLLELIPDTTRKANAHMVGVKEHVVVLRGSLLTGTEEHPVFLKAGQIHSFPGDCNHIYRSFDDAAAAIVTVVYPVTMPICRSSFDLVRPWPQTEDQWSGLESQLSRIKLEISQGIETCRLSLDDCNLAPPEALAKLDHLLQGDPGFRAAVPAFSVFDEMPSIIFFSRPHSHFMLQQADHENQAVTEASNLANRAISTWRPLDSNEITALRRQLKDKSIVTATLAAEVLTRHGMPSVPARIGPKRTNKKTPANKSGASTTLFEDRIDVDAYAAYELVHPAYAKQSVAIAKCIVENHARNNLRLLDVGTGPGRPLQMLLELVPELQVTAIDPSESSYHHLCRLFKGDKRVKPVLASITNIPGVERNRFDVAISVGASHHLNTSHFFQSTHRQIKPGALFLVADEMIAPFHEPRERQANLIAHHLQYVSDTLVDIPADALTEAERLLVELLRQQVPAAIHEARSGCVAASASRCRLLLKKLGELDLGESISHQLLAFYRFHFLELEALVAGLDYEVEQKTYPRCFAELAQHSGFEVCEHSRLYATHGLDDWDGGTHFFVLRALP
ncbi:MAG: helix-turn-helix domain-containing protein [Betaproteobacteria bacterium]|nr:helix-turn-helix domain-containing protein [Betaproteobacteria bacterium]